MSSTAAARTIDVSMGRSELAGVMTITLSRPSINNAFNFAMYTDLIAALDTAAADDSIGVVVLTGDGPFFSSGADLKEVAAQSPAPGFADSDDSDDDSDDDDGDGGAAGAGAGAVAGGLRSWDAPVGRYFERVLTFPKILIAAVNGPAIGVGATTLLHCDVVVAVTGAYMWMPFARIAVVPEFCSSRVLASRVGPAKAALMLYAQEKLYVDEPAAAGWVSRVVAEQNELLPHAYAVAKAMLDPPLAVATLTKFKRMITGPDTPALLATAESELDALDARIHSGEVATAVVAYFNAKYNASKL